MKRGDAVVGRRVRVHPASPVLTLAGEPGGDIGRIIRADDQWDGYWIVRLERPARYDNGVGAPEWLDEVRVAIDNLEPLEPRGVWPVMPAET